MISQYRIIFVVIVLLIGFSVKSQQRNKQQIDEQLAAEFYNQGEYEKAVFLYEEFYLKNNNAYYYSNLFNCYLKLKSYKKAEKIVKKQIKKQPLSFNYLVDLGYVYQISGDKEKAEKQYLSTIQKLEQNKNQVINLANSFFMRKKGDYAIKTYLHGRIIFKGYYDFYFELASAYSKTKEYSLMFEELLNLISNDPDQLSDVQDFIQPLVVDIKDDNINEMLLNKLQGRIQKQSGKLVYVEMMLWFAVQLKNFKQALRQAISIDRRQKEDGFRILKISKLCFSNKEYDIAAEGFKYIIEKGKSNKYFISATKNFLKVKKEKLVNTPTIIHNELITLENEYNIAINDMGKNSQAIELIRDLAHLQGFYLSKEKESIELLNSTLTMNISIQEKARCKIILADIYLFIGEIWESTLLYSQVEKSLKNDPIGHEAKLKNARLSYFIGEFNWAKAQLDVLKASTSKLISNDAMKLSMLISDNNDIDSTYNPLAIYSRADLFFYRNKDSLALITIDSIKTAFPNHSIADDVLFKKSEYYIANNNYSVADSLLQIITNNYSYDILADDAIFLSAEINELYLNNINKAKNLYQKILSDYSGSIYVVKARERYRKLRGDEL